MFHVAALGELLIDFTPSRVSETDSEMFEKNPGGAPANVLAAVSKLGKPAAFLGMVGTDKFGVFLKEVLEDNNIDTTGLKFTDKANTTLAFVHLDKSGDRSFSFYRNPGADMLLSMDDVEFEVIRNSNIFHFGSVSLTEGPARSATLAAVKYARENGITVSYDPNLRPPLWRNLEDARLAILSTIGYADILKISEEELKFITTVGDLEEGTDMLYRVGISLILVTLGPGGCFYRYKGGCGKVGTYDVNVVDTTGAGDAFLGGFLYKLGGRKLDEVISLDIDEFEDVISFANAVGALATTRKGAIPAMPSLEQVYLCQKNIKRL